MLAFSTSLSAPIRQQPATVTANFGVRQGLVLSPFFFNIYLDDISRINDCTKRKCIIVYSDDILLIAQSVSELEILFKRLAKKQPVHRTCFLFSWPTCMLAFSTSHVSRSWATRHVIQTTKTHDVDVKTHSHAQK